MKNLTNIVATLVMVTILAVGTTFAGDGILVAGKDGILVAGKGRTASNTKVTPCSQSTDGILVAGIADIVVSAITGILVAGRASTDCSLQGTDGILVAG